MKLKKIISLAAAAVMSLSTVTALAGAYVAVPDAGNDNARYAVAASFYNDGYYYEAQTELGYIDTTSPYYDAAKHQAWLNKVNYKIDRYNVATLIAEAKKLNSQGKFNSALFAIWQAGMQNPTQQEYYSLDWWEKAILKNMGVTDSLSMSQWTAIKAVVYYNYNNGIDQLDSNYERYVPVRVEADDNGSPARWDIYVQTKTPDGKWVDLYAYNVYDYGTVVGPFVPIK